MERVSTRIWDEVPEPDNPFAAAACYCQGYDVYGEVLGNAHWAEYLYLLFRGERPSAAQSRLFNDLAVALANPGPRDHSVRAAMNGGVGGSTYAACLTAALAVGAGQLGGAHEVRIGMEYWEACGQEMAAWRDRLGAPPTPETADIWPPMEHAPGFDPHGADCATPVRQTLTHLARISPGQALAWLKDNRVALEHSAGCPLSFSGVAAAALVDIGFTPSQGEMLYLLLRLPGAAAHALEQQALGWREYPFFRDGLMLEENHCPEGGAGEYHGTGT